LFEFIVYGVLGGMEFLHHPNSSLAHGGLFDLFRNGCIFSVSLCSFNSMVYGLFDFFMGGRLSSLWSFCYWEFLDARMFLGMRFSASDREKKSEKNQSATSMSKQYKSQ